MGGWVSDLNGKFHYFLLTLPLGIHLDTEDYLSSQSQNIHRLQLVLKDQDDDLQIKNLLYLEFRAYLFFIKKHINKLGCASVKLLV